MRVVIDTNVLVSFAIRPNPAFERIFDYIAAHGVSLVSDDTITELFEVLSRDKFRKYVPLDQSITDHVVACRDPKDDKFLSVAVSGKADCIIAGDRHLFDVIEFKGIPIYRPAQFVRLFIG